MPCKCVYRDTVIHATYMVTIIRISLVAVTGKLPLPAISARNRRDERRAPSSLPQQNSTVLSAKLYVRRCHPLTHTYLIQ